MTWLRLFCSSTNGRCVGVGMPTPYRENRKLFAKSELVNGKEQAMAWNLEEAITYYKHQGAPGDQSALVSLLREVQEEHGGIPCYELDQIASGLGVRESFLLALIRRLPSLRLADRHCLELCAGPNCGKAAVLAAFAERLRSEKVEVRFVPCMRLCGKGPNLRWDGKLHHRADEALTRRLTEGL